MGSEMCIRDRHWICKRQTDGEFAASETGTNPTTSLRNLLILIAVTTILSSVQLIPAIPRTAESVRSEYQLPRTVFETQGFSSDEIKAGLLGPPPPGTHHDHLYQFSQAPWTLPELMYPNFSGRAFPLHTRWIEALPGTDRMWTPSLYAGCLAFVLALTAFRLWGKRRRQVWLSRMTLFFVLGSFGWYGLCLLYTSPSPRDGLLSRMPSSA